jgi:uncharacterized protein Yka (UPF0111/DUF47 family)
MSVLQNMIKWLIPDEARFYDFVLAVGESSERCARVLNEIAQTERADQRLELLPAVGQAERDGDVALRRMAEALDATFVTPIDREDLYHLAAALEVVSDFASSTANQLTVHQMQELPEGTRELARILLEATTRCVEACRALQANEPDGIRSACRDIERLEKEADLTFRRQMGLLFANERDAIKLIKDKEFLEGLEGAVDRCADVGKVLEAILIKHG